MGGGSWDDDDEDISDVNIPGARRRPSRSSGDDEPRAPAAEWALREYRHQHVEKGGSPPPTATPSPPDASPREPEPAAPPQPTAAGDNGQDAAAVPEPSEATTPPRRGPEADAQDQAARTSKPTSSPGPSPSAPRAKPPRGASVGAQEDDPRETRRVSQIEFLWGRWPGGLWLPIVKGFVDVVRVEKLGGIQLALLLLLVAQWRFHESSTKFPIDTRALATALGISRRTVSENIAALREKRLIHAGGGFTCNQTWVDLQQLRTRVSGTTERLDGPVRGMRVFDLWGFARRRGGWFVAIPMPIVELMRKPFLQEEMTWLALFAAAVKYGRTEKKVFPVRLRKFAAGMCVPERSARRCLRTLTTADQATGRPSLLRKVGDLPRSRWAVDIAPLLVAIARSTLHPAPTGM